MREGALVLLLSSIGVSDEQAIALGLAIYAMTLVGSLIGFPLLVFGGRSSVNPTPVPADSVTP